MLQFPQGRIPTKSLVKRCKYCGKYPDTTMRHHLRYICNLPENPEYIGPWIPKKERSEAP